jgi:hypothetical protein
MGAAMTPKEHAALSMGYRSLAAKMLLEWMARILRDTYAQVQPEDRGAAITRVREKLEDMRQTLSETTVPELDSAQSDMETAIVLEHFDELAAEVLRIVAGGA